MERKVVHTNNGLTFVIEGKVVVPKYDACSVEFYVNGSEQHVLTINLSRKAVIALDQELTSFDPHEWLWETGCDIIKNGAESNALMDGNFMISDQVVHLGKQISFMDLQMDYASYIEQIKKIKSAVVTWTKLPQTQPYSIKESGVYMEGEMLHLPDIQKSLHITKDNIIQVAQGFYQELQYGGIVFKIEFMS